MIALVTDSNSQLPDELARRYAITVVPLHVSVDGVDHLEGVDLDADGFYARFENGASPTVSTSQPSPGQFAAAYAAAAAAGADEIVSIHIGSSVSGTCNSARLAAAGSPVPVRIVDTGTASFAVACCVWEAAVALAAEADADGVVAAAESVAATVGNVFVVRALSFPRAGGRLAEGADGVPVLSLIAGTMQPIAQVRSLDEAADAMAAHILAAGDGLRVGIGVADRGAAPLWQGLEDRLRGARSVAELVRYRIGPSVGAHTGPGTAGAVYYPSTSTISPRMPVSTT